MDANRIAMRTPILLLSLAMMLAGCKSAIPDDATLNTQVQSRLFSDQNLAGQAIHCGALDAEQEGRLRHPPPGAHPELPAPGIGEEGRT